MRQPPSIDAFGGGGFRVSGQWRPGSLLILADEARDWSVSSLAEVTPQSLEPVFKAPLEAVEFVLLGTGASQALPSKLLRDALGERRIGLEFMATHAAARLYNVLASEGRRVAAALIAV